MLLGTVAGGASNAAVFMPVGTPVESVIVQNGRKCHNSTWADGSERVREYHLKTDELLVSKFRRKTLLGAFEAWENEVGELKRTVITSVQTMIGADVIMRESALTPFLVRKDSDSHFVWRLRNSVWPIHVYSVTVESNLVVIRTSNRKYFTRFGIPDLDRAGILLDAGSLLFEWAASVLVVRYAKPKLVLELERKDRASRNEMMTTSTDSKLKNEKAPQEGDVQCPQS